MITRVQLASYLPRSDISLEHVRFPSTYNRIWHRLLQIKKRRKEITPSALCLRAAPCSVSSCYTFCCVFVLHLVLWLLVTPCAVFSCGALRFALFSRRPSQSAPSSLSVFFSRCLRRSTSSSISVFLSQCLLSRCIRWLASSSVGALCPCVFVASYSPVSVFFRYFRK